MPHYPSIQESFAAQKDVQIQGSFENYHRPEIFHRVIGQLTGGVYEGMSLLDVACGYNFILERSVRAGASYLGVEAREENIALANQRIPEVLRGRAKVVRNLCQNVTLENYGQFDVILIAGIIYHLSAADNYLVLKNVRRMFRRGLLIDTALTMPYEIGRAMRYYAINGMVYGGFVNIEHEKTVTPEQMEQRLRASYSTNAAYPSFLLQGPCFNRMMRHLGYQAVFEYMYRGAFNDLVMNFEFDRLSHIGKFRRNVRQLFVMPGAAHETEMSGPFTGLPVAERDGSLAPAAWDQVFQRCVAQFKSATGDYYSAVDDLAACLPVQFYPVVITAALSARPTTPIDDFRFLKVYLDPCIRFAGHDTRIEALALLCAVLLRNKTETDLRTITAKSFVECFAEFYRAAPAETLANDEKMAAHLASFATSKLLWQRTLAGLGEVKE